MNFQDTHQKYIKKADVIDVEGSAIFQSFKYYNIVIWSICST